MEHQKIGADLARSCKWDLDNLAPVILAALTDANFHSLAARVERLINEEFSRGSSNDLPI